MFYEQVTIQDFPDYLISNHGEVFNKHTGRPLSLSTTQKGVVKVGIVRGGVQYQRSLKVLVADAFVPGRDELFNTPVLLDGNQRNCRADNIIWRPHWHAWRYAHQFSTVSDNDHIGPVRIAGTSLRYDDVYEAATMNGVLFTDVRKSIITKEPVFPTFQVFELG